MTATQTTILPIAKQGEAILQTPAQTVNNVHDPAIQQLIDDMHATMCQSAGVGIAAPQVFHALRLIIVASRPNSRYPNAPHMQPVAMVNPEICWRSDEECCGWEGCLSVPDTRAQVRRAKHIRVRYLNRRGNRLEVEYEGFIARIIQHECDHLDGILFPERVKDANQLISEATFQALTAT